MNTTDSRALVRIFFTIPSVSTPVRWSFFKMIATNIPGLMFALTVPSMVAILCCYLVSADVAIVFTVGVAVTRRISAAVSAGLSQCGKWPQRSNQ